MQRRLWPAVAAATLLPASICFGRNHAASEVSFKWAEEKILVEASTGDTNGLCFVIDTGASTTVIGSRLARRLKLEGREDQVVAKGKTVAVLRAVLPELRIGPHRFEEVPVLVSNSRYFKRGHADGLIGLSLLRRKGIVIDFMSRTIRFGGSIEHGRKATAFYPNGPCLVVRLVVSGQPLRLLLDTGGTELILFAKRVKGRLPTRPTGERFTSRSLTGKVRLTKVGPYSVTWGETQWKELDAYVMASHSPAYGSLDGLLGTSALGLKLLRLDFDKGLISWVR